MSAPVWLGLPSHRAWLDEHGRSLLRFARRFPAPGGGASYLDDDGVPDAAQPVHAYVTGRMAHVYALGTLLGVPGCAPLVDAALDGFRGPLRDVSHGGWFSAVLDGEPAAGKQCYAHAFVVLGSSSAVVAGRPGARELLDEALAVLLERFWDESVGMFTDTWDTGWTALDPYRGINANMHCVEALLAAADVTGDKALSDRAVRIAVRVAHWARGNGWRIPEHFTADWQPDLEYNADNPSDPFKPYGATVGHALEWSRLLLGIEAAGGPSDFREAAAALFDRAVQDGWYVDGAPGFVYTTGWDGRPVVHDRMHWVATEAIGAAAALYAVTGEASYASRYADWWDYAARYLIDADRGSWHHQLDPANRPVATVWPGKPDVYHAFQATVIPTLPAAPSLATALARRDR